MDKRHDIIQPMQTKKKKPKPCVVTLTLGDNTLVGSGETVLAALRAIKKPVKITTKSVLTVTKDNKTHLRPLTIPLAKRLFYPASQIHVAKNLDLVLK